MIIDTSALAAVVLREPERERLVTAILSAPSARVPAPSLVELTTVIDGRQRPGLAEEFDTQLARLGVGVIAFDAHHARRARELYRTYGKGRGHRARLNLLDCMAQAVAQEEEEPLLFKGDDFTHSGVRNALAEFEAGSG